MSNKYETRLSIPANKVKELQFVGDETIDTMNNLGISIGRDAWNRIAQDASLQTTASVSTPIQFLQHFFKKPIVVVTTARKADKILGREMAGTWGEEEIVQPIIELTGNARPYGDYDNNNVSSFNTNFEKRSIVRFEEDVEANQLEMERASAMMINSIDMKRQASAESLAISMNLVAFNGYNGGNNRTFGLLNDPNMPNYVTLPNGASGTSTWASKTFNEITNDINLAMTGLATKTGNNFDQFSDESVLVIASTAWGYLSTVNTLGTLSVRRWIEETYPRCRIEVAPQFENANGNSSVLYLMAEKLGGEKVIGQYIQETLRLIGFERTAKGMLECYSNATAGVMLKQPIGVMRFTGC